MIPLRKINSLLVIIMILMFVNHAVLSLLFLYGLIDYSPSFKITGRRLFYPIVLHIIISSYLYLKDKMRKNKVYPKLIAETTQQFITGICIVIFVGLHIFSYMMLPINFSSEFHFKLLHFLIDILLFASISMHLRVSIPRLLVSFGFLDNKNSFVNFKDKFNLTICILLLIAILAEIVYYGVIL